MELLQIISLVSIIVTNVCILALIVYHLTGIFRQRCANKRIERFIEEIVLPALKETTEEITKEAPKKKRGRLFSKNK